VSTGVLLGNRGDKKKNDPITLFQIVLSFAGLIPVARFTQ
jgi:hypothetical protein